MCWVSFWFIWKGYATLQVSEWAEYVLFMDNYPVTDSVGPIGCF